MVALKLDAFERLSMKALTTQASRLKMSKPPLTIESGRRTHISIGRRKEKLS